MEVTAGGPPISVSVLVVDPTAAVSHVDPAVVVTRMVPVLELSYIELAFTASMDDSGLYQYKADMAVVVDSTAIAFSHPESDNFTLEDASLVATSKGLADSVGTSDVCLPVLVFMRDFFDTATLTDTQALLTSPAYVETITPADALAFSHDKAFADGFSMNDMADAGGPIWSFSDTTANIIAVSDSSLLSSDKGVSDSVAPTDSGRVFAYNYVDPTYFAEDYVGVLVTF